MKEQSNKSLLLLLAVSCILCMQGTTAEVNAEDTVKVFTVASSETDGYKRYIRSARVYDIDVQTLGLGEAWKGGDMLKQGGGYKINLLRKALEPYKDDKQKIILFTDSFDVIFTSGLKEIVENFKETGAKILFSAEKYCWPDESVADQYDVVAPKAARFLNSGGFIGYAPQVYDLIARPIKDTEDDQGYYTKIYLNKDVREKLGIKLDTKSTVFQNLNGAIDDVKLKVDLATNQGTLQNVNFLTQPSIVHGNGPSKVDLNAFGNYLAKTFNGHCTFCQENRLSLDEKNLPVITLALMVAQPVPFFDLFLNQTASLNYPKKKLNLYIYCGAELHDQAAKSFLKAYEKDFNSVKIVVSSDKLDERRGRQLALQQAKQRKSDYVFFVDADAHIEDPEVLRELLSMNKQFVAPIFSKYNELWSNFWGGLSDSGFYARSHDYVDIVKRDLIGMWNVPYVSSIYLVKSSAFPHMNYDHTYYDADMAMCHSLRQAGVHMFVTNQRYHGHLVNLDKFNSSLTRPDFYTLLDNQYDWIKKYIRPEYEEQLKENSSIEQPCPDVFWFAIVTDAFCDDLVAIAETFGQWSDGSHNDNRLQGGYEAVPTRDIHMRQVGLDELWLKFLNLFVRPLQERVFTGYSNPAHSVMNFLVRYRPDEQPSLRPHHDSSTYTINIALNNVGVDYEGGGCHFIRYNCSVTQTKKGWLLMHPGRLTHYHEGLLVTKGTRYIMISFINP